jgi:hypothetical protein
MLATSVSATTMTLLERVGRVVAINAPQPINKTPIIKLNPRKSSWTLLAAKGRATCQLRMVSIIAARSGVAGANSSVAR